MVGTAPLSPDMAGNQAALAAGANSSFTSAFANSGTLASITASNPFFTPPSIANPTQRIHSPRYQEWNLELQQGFGQKMSVSLNYVGNHGIFIPLQNTGVNAFCDASWDFNLRPLPADWVRLAPGSFRWWRPIHVSEA